MKLLRNVGVDRVIDEIRVRRARLSHHSRRPRKRSCDSMTDSSRCARSNPGRPLSALLLRSLPIWSAHETG